MMHLRAELLYYSDYFVRVIKLPYIDDEIEMIIILPRIRFNLFNIREKITGEDLIQYIYHAVPIYVEVSITFFFFSRKLI